MSGQYAVQAAALSAAIHVGRPNKAGTAFASKEDLTDDVLLAVAAHVERHFGGRLRTGYVGAESDLAIEVTVTRSPRQEAPR